MAYPTPPPAVNPMVAYPVPVPPPPGHGVLVATFNRGPYLVSAATTSRLKLNGREVPFPGEGTWHIAVPAGRYEAKLTDFIGMPLIKTTVDVQAGMAHQLSFRFGGWRNRVHDGHGTDVTTFGLWSNYSMLLVVMGVTGVVCCGGFGVLGALGSTA